MTTSTTMIATRQTILIVDDTPENLMVLGELLQPFYRVKVASSGAVALNIATTAPLPDLILLDVMMPEMDGYMVLDHLQKTATTRDIPVIFITAADAIEDVSHGLALGAVDYITKPIHPPIVLARIHTHLELKQTRDRLKEQNASLIHSNTDLSRAVRAKDEFLANMSHELRTPLNAILGMSEVLQEQVYGPLNERQLKSVATIERSGQHLLSLINDILDLSKVESGKVELEREFLPIDLVCQASLQFIRQQALKKHINVLLHMDTALRSVRQDDVPGTTPGASRQRTIYADERRLKQILVNLLANAVKFTPDGGDVGLDVQAEEDHPIIHFAVWDTGIGIAPDDQQRLFQPFIQVDSSLAREYEGTGLGLALVMRLTELHGGTVSLESEVGKGSRFTVSLPRYPTGASDEQGQQPFPLIPATEALPPTLTEAPVHPVHSSKLILLAEDNEANIITVSDFLEVQGYQVVLARNGIEAVDAARLQQPALILMDIQMPKLDGLEAIRIIRAEKHLAHIPIIALTALAMNNDREQCLQAGATDYLSKPVRLKELAQLIEHHLDKTS